MAKEFRDKELLHHQTEFGDDEIAHWREDRASGAWEEFVLSGRPGALARYLEAGGEIDEEVKQLLIDILRHGPKNGASRKDQYRDFVAFVDIRIIALSEDLTKTAACRKYAEQTNQEQRTVELQYKRGSEISQSLDATS